MTGPGPSSPSRTPNTRQRTSPALGLVAVGAAFLVAQIVLFDESRFLEWDEAVYVGNASSRFETPGWAAHRAFGVPLLLKPAFWVSGSFVWMRWYLAILSTVAVTAAFASWSRPIGRAAPLAMAFFCSNWLVLFYGTEASPNLFVAACAVGATGSLVQYGHDGSRRSLLTAAGALAAAAVMRPSDAIVLTAILFAISLVVAPSRWRDWGTTLTAGVTLGLLPWVVDAFVRFGGPIERWQTASALVESSLGSRLLEHMHLLDGPLMGPDRSDTIPVATALFVGSGLVLAILAVVLFGSRPATLALMASVLAAAPYLFYVGALAPRFLLPALGLLSVGAGVGAAGLVTMSPRFGTAAVAVLIGLGFTSAIGPARTVHLDETERREAARVVGGELRRLSASRPCLVLASYGPPQLAVSSGCRAHRLDTDDPACQSTELRARGEALLVGGFGDVPDDLAPALIGSPVPGPLKWWVAEIDPTLLVCELSPIAAKTED